MPALPSASEWLPSGAVMGFGVFLFGWLRGDMKTMEERLRGDMKTMEGRLQGDMKTMEGRLQGDMKTMEERLRGDMREMRAEHRADNKALNEKLDRLVESHLAARRS